MAGDVTQACNEIEITFPHHVQQENIFSHTPKLLVVS